MTYDFDIDMTGDDLDFAATVTGGQTFRWRHIGGNQWVGVDGAMAAEVHVHSGHLAVRCNQPVATFERFLRQGEDHGQIRAKLAQAMPELEAVLEQCKGMRLLRQQSPVEVLFSFLCSANNHIARITKMVDSLAVLGLPMAAVGGPFWEFPTLEVIAGVSSEALRTAGFGYRAATIPRVAQELVSRGGLPYLEALRTADYERVCRELTSIPSIGPKVADCVALYGFDKGLSVPVDVHIWRAATEFWFPEWRGKALTIGRYRAVGDLLRDRFGELAGSAQQYIFVWAMSGNDKMADNSR